MKNKYKVGSKSKSEKHHHSHHGMKMGKEDESGDSNDPANRYCGVEKLKSFKILTDGCCDTKLKSITYEMAPAEGSGYMKVESLSLSLALCVGRGLAVKGLDGPPVCWVLVSTCVFLVFCAWVSCFESWRTGVVNASLSCACGGCWIEKIPFCVCGSFHVRTPQHNYSMVGNGIWIFRTMEVTTLLQLL